MIEKCAHENCDADSIVVPVIRVPAKGWPIDLHQPLKMIMGLHICDAHKAQFDVKEMLNDDLRNIFKIAANGKCEPDFDRAFVEWCKIGSAEYNALIKTRQQRGEQELH